MGLYNPHFPYVIGEEWVPIRQEEVAFSPAVSSVELGHEFVNNNTESISSGRFYVSKFPTRVPAVGVALFLAQPFFTQLYAAGTEDQTGPINVVRIPVSSGTLVNASLSNAANAQQALASPVDGRKIIMSITSGGILQSSAEISFSMAQFNQLLINKRILAVNCVYNISLTSDPNASFMRLYADGGTEINYGSATYDDQGVMRMGDTNWWFSVTTPGLSFPSPFPWTPASVRRFEGTHASPIVVGFQADSNADFQEAAQWDFVYAALDVYYCEESRIAMAGSITRTQGVNSGPLYTPNESFTTTLSAKRYLVTVTGADTGDSRSASNDTSLLSQPYPSLNALRQLYPTTFHPGVRINHPSPIGANVIGQTFTSEASSVLPQVTLHKSSGSPDILGDVHVYGNQVAAQVYGNVVAVQTIEDFGVNDVTTQQVRYYARRFGDTTARLELARSSALSNIIAAITPAEWDELEPEGGIIDGWKEVTLDLDIPQQFAGTRPGFQWQAANETVGNRWEILAMVAAAVSGTPVSQYAPAPAVYQLGDATYGFPISGSADALRWLQVPPSQPLSAVPVTKDPTADAVLMFAVTPPAVTGFALSELTQELVGIAEDECRDSCCVPTGIQYNQLSWIMGVLDEFERVAVSGWGSMDTGQAWTSDSLSVDVSDGSGNVTFPAAALGAQVVVSDVGLTDYEVYAEVTPHALLLTGNAGYGFMLRWANSSAYVAFEAELAADGDVNALIFRRDAGFTTLAQADDVAVYDIDTTLSIKAQAVGSVFRGKVWIKGTEEPPWQVTANDTTYMTQRGFGVRPTVSAGFTPLPWEASYDKINIYPVSLSDGGVYELQRMDELTDWQTIMRANPEPSVRSFNDYEARVGIMSAYRIRIIDALNFYGTWSSILSGAITSPGITGAPCMDGNGALIFTSNADQDGAYNLAYTQTWDRGGVSEDFSFPEATTVQLQRVYQRDFPVAFKGTERGGEQFARTLLVHNAAVSPERLANISSLREMAWADLPYVCVRDEIGDRWFALVQVPSESVRRNRQLYLANIAVTQVTDTAYPVEP